MATEYYLWLLRMFRVLNPPKEMGKSMRPTGHETSEEQLLRTSEVPGTFKLIKNRSNLIKVTFLLKKKEFSLNTQYFVPVKAGNSWAFEK